MHPDVEEALPGTTYNALTRRAGHFPNALLPASPALFGIACCLSCRCCYDSCRQFAVPSSVCHTGWSPTGWLWKRHRRSMPALSWHKVLGLHALCATMLPQAVSLHGHPAGPCSCCCAGGRLGSKPIARRLVIDVREFMSSLPAVLHQQGLQIVPVTLEVGSCTATSVSGVVAALLQVCSARSPGDAYNSVDH